MSNFSFSQNIFERLLLHTWTCLGFYIGIFGNTTGNITQQLKQISNRNFVIHSFKILSNCVGKGENADHYDFLVFPTFFFLSIQTQGPSFELQTIFFNTKKQTGYDNDFSLLMPPPIL